jgi:hypothetical protein
MYILTDLLPGVRVEKKKRQKQNDEYDRIKARQTISNQRRDRNQLESITEQHNHLKYEAFTKSSQRYVQSLIETKEECKMRLSNEATRKRIQQRNRDLVNCSFICNNNL